MIESVPVTSRLLPGIQQNLVRQRKCSFQRKDKFRSSFSCQQYRAAVALMSGNRWQRTPTPVTSNNNKNRSSSLCTQTPQKWNIISVRKNKATMATKKKNNKASRDTVTAQCDQYIAEVNEFNAHQWKTGVMQVSVWRNAGKQNDVNGIEVFMAVEIYNAVIWIMMTSCLVIVTEQEQTAASTL